MHLPKKIREIIDQIRGGSSPDFSMSNVRRKQLLMSGGVIAVSFLSVGAVLLWRADSVKSHEKNEKAIIVTPKTVTTPLESVDERDIWVSRVENQAKEIHEDAEKVRKENEILEKRIDVLEELFKERNIDQKIADEEAAKRAQIALEKPERHYNSSANKAPNQFPQVDQSEIGNSAIPESYSADNAPAKIGHISRTSMSVTPFKTVETYLPATTTCKAVMTSGVVAPAGPESKNNPKPVTLRIVDDGKLPRGFTSRVRGAEVNAACHGDISTERVECRLVSMTWIEPNGVIVERNIEGWIYGEDGSEGLRGKVVDRSGDVAREAYFAGVLSGFSNFFKFEAQSSVYPASPFGVTNALSPGNAVHGAAASGVSNAMEKLADRSIKRLDQMQPVIVITGGRLVDVRFKAGFSLEPDQSAEMKMVGDNKEEGDS